MNRGLLHKKKGKNGGVPNMMMLYRKMPKINWTTNEKVLEKPDRRGIP